MIEQIFAIVSAIISLIALFLSIFSLWQSRASIVKDFFAQGDSKEMKEYRKIIYDIYNQKMDESDILDKLKQYSVEVSHVVSFYDCWALMVKKHYLPKWAFQASSKYTAKNIYDKIKPYIEFRRETQFEYASHFEWLIKKIQ